MRYFKDTYFIVFGILFVYLFFNLPLYFQAYTWKVPIIRLQIVEFASWAHLLVYIFILFFVTKVYLWVDKSIIKAYILWLTYSLIANIALIRFSYHPAYYFYLLFTILPYYFLFLMLLIGWDELNRLKLQGFADKIVILLGKSYVFIFIFAVFQFVFKEDFLSLNTSDKTLQVSSELLGLFRPRSIFNSSFEFGLFSILVFSLFSSRIVLGRNQSNRVDWMPTILSACGVIISFTRNIYLIWVMALIALFLLQNKKVGSKVLKVVPHVFMFFSSLLLIILAFQALSGLVLSDLFSNESTYVRFTLLYALVEGLVLNSNLIDILFGWGLIQHPGDSTLIGIFPDIYNSEDGTLGIDNLFFALFLYQGVIGLSIFLYLYQKIWNNLCSISRTSNSSLALGAAVFFSTFLGAGVFNLIHYGIFGYLAWFFAFLVLAIYSPLTNPKESDTSS
jgi:hypothetical protein